jgi:hypothetical protein
MKIFTITKNIIYDLVTERQNGNERKISIGRVAFITILLVAIKIWLGVPLVDIPNNLFLTLSALLAYVLGTKAISGWAALGAMKHATGNEEIKNASVRAVVDGDEGD